MADREPNIKIAQNGDSLWIDYMGGITIYWDSNLGREQFDAIIDSIERYRKIIAVKDSTIEALQKKK